MPLPLIPIAAGLATLGGLFGEKGRQKAPSSKELAKMFGPNALAGDTMQLYRMLAGSPQFQQLLSQNAVTGSQFQGDLSSSLAQRGLDTSGIGTIAGAAGRSAISSGESALRGGLFGTAGNLAQQNLLARLESFTGLRSKEIGQPSFLSQLSGDVLSAAIPSLFKTGQKTGG